MDGEQHFATGLRGEDFTSPSDLQIFYTVKIACSLCAIVKRAA